MQLRCNVLLSCAGLMLLSQVPMAGAVSLYALEEPVTTLVSPPNAQTFVSPMTYSYNAQASTAVATTITATPLLCANTSAPAAQGTALNPVYYSANGLAGTTPLPFVFGASPGSPSISATASGAQGVGMSPTEMRFFGDALGSLVCYGLNADGTRRLTRDVFMDGLDGGLYNSTVTLSVTHLPATSTDYYGYRIDVTLPPLPVDDEFALVEGFDASVFATTAAESLANVQGTWCQSFDSQTCASAQYPGNINYSYVGGVNSSLPAPVAPNPAVQYHFLVKRYLRNGVASLPSTGAPVAMVALFSPNDLEENKLDDNVASGNNQLANAAPSMAQDATNSTFAGSLTALAENTDSGTLTFDITDKDTVETGASKLTAAVTLNLPGNISVPVSANCSTLLSSPGVAPVTRACTIDIPLNNAAFWNAQVGADFANAFNAVATDVTNGSYANGVTSSLGIIITDPLGKSSTASPQIVHIHSTANNAPAIGYTGAFVDALDPNNNQTYATYSCSVSAGGSSGGCGAGRGTIFVDLGGVVDAPGGPPASFDEVASQTTAVVPFSDPNDTGTNVQCVSEQQALVFSTNGGPLLEASPGSGTHFDMNFLISSTPPTSAVSSLCTLTITDVGPFPNGQSAATANKQFRIVINP